MKVEVKVTSREAWFPAAPDEMMLVIYLQLAYSSQSKSGKGKHSSTELGTIGVCVFV